MPSCPASARCCSPTMTMPITPPRRSPKPVSRSQPSSIRAPHRVQWRSSWRARHRSTPGTRSRAPPGGRRCAGSASDRSPAARRISRSIAICSPCRAVGIRSCICSRKRRAGCASTRTSLPSCPTPKLRGSNVSGRRAAASRSPAASPKAPPPELAPLPGAVLEAVNCRHRHRWRKKTPRAAGCRYCRCRMMAAAPLSICTMT